MQVVLGNKDIVLHSLKPQTQQGVYEYVCMGNPRSGEVLSYAN